MFQLRMSALVWLRKRTHTDEQRCRCNIGGRWMKGSVRLPTDNEEASERAPLRRVLFLTVSVATVCVGFLRVLGVWGDFGWASGY